MYHVFLWKPAIFIFEYILQQHSAGKVFIFFFKLFLKNQNKRHTIALYCYYYWTKFDFSFGFRSSWFCDSVRLQVRRYKRIVFIIPEGFDNSPKIHYSEYSQFSAIYYSHKAFNEIVVNLCALWKGGKVTIIIIILLSQPLPKGENCLVYIYIYTYTRGVS